MHFTLFQKIGLSILIFAWLIFGSMMLSDILIKVDNSNIDALRLVSLPPSDDVSVEQEAEPEAAAQSAGLDVLMASTDAAAGKSVFKNCKACHSIDKGGKNKIGPNLWNIVGKAQASTDGFKYSDALSSRGGTWSFEELNGFLTKPSEYISGTKMKYKGIKKDGARAALLMYLRAQSDNPLALP